MRVNCGDELVDLLLPRTRPEGQQQPRLAERDLRAIRLLQQLCQAFWPHSRMLERRPGLLQPDSDRRRVTNRFAAPHGSEAAWDTAPMDEGERLAQDLRRIHDMVVAEERAFDEALASGDPDGAERARARADAAWALFDAVTERMNALLRKSPSTLRPGA